MNERAAQARVLLVDATPAARAATRNALLRQGHDVHEATSAPQAQSLLQSLDPDLLVLDTGIPSGIPLLQRAREQNRDLSILVVTGQATVESAIAAVKADAVDYVVKPCDGETLRLTVARALEERAEKLRHKRVLNMVSQVMDALREPVSAPTPQPQLAPQESSTRAVDPRSNGHPVDGNGKSAVKPEGEPVRVGALELDREKRVATVRSPGAASSDPPRRIELTEGEVSILLTLMARPNQVLSYNQIAQAALGYEGMDKWTVENVVRSSVFRLRHKLEPDAVAPQLICTVRGRGYYLAAS